jgi:hypothetical protein
MADYWFGDKLTAIFIPRDLSTVPPSMVGLSGQTFEWDYVGTGDNEDEFPGISRWAIAGSDVRLWVPIRDLQVGEVQRVEPTAMGVQDSAVGDGAEAPTLEEPRVIRADLKQPA